MRLGKLIVIFVGLLFLMVGCSNISSDTGVGTTAPTIGTWAQNSPLPPNTLTTSTKSNADILPPKDTWNFKVQTSSYAYYAKSVWKAGSDTVIQNYWVGTPNKWQWNDVYLVFTQKAYGAVTIIPKGSEIYVVSNGILGSSNKQLQTIQEWTGSDKKTLDFRSNKSPMVVNWQLQKTSSIASSIDITVQSDNSKYPSIGSDLSQNLMFNGTVLEGTGKYRLNVKSSGYNWRIIIGVEP